jgi:hypothetical protein
LKAVETKFAIDSSGFSASRFERWFDHKWGDVRSIRTWVKAHIMCGVTTNVIGQTLAYLHVMAERLSSRHCYQRGLFDQPTEQQQAVADAKRLINQRIGRFALRSAATLPLVQLYGDSANNYEVCDIQGKTCI